MKMNDDQQLLQKMIMGDGHAFEQLYERHADRIYYTAIRFHFSSAEAEELVQDVFVKVWENRANLQENLSFKGYLLTIAKNMLINQLKRKAYEVTCKQYFQKYQQHFENSTEDYIIFSDLEKHVWDFIDSMPTKRRQILMLKREKGLTSKEISEQLGIPVRTVETNVYKLNRDLKAFLGNGSTFSWAALALVCSFLQKL